MLAVAVAVAVAVTVEAEAWVAVLWAVIVAVREHILAAAVIRMEAMLVVIQAVAGRN
jgi:hypothetical protein